MVKFFAIIFTSLTIGAAYMTYYDIGVQGTEIEKNRSVRSGSHSGSGYNYGK